MDIENQLKDFHEASCKAAADEKIYNDLNRIRHNTKRAMLNACGSREASAHLTKEYLVALAKFNEFAKGYHERARKYNELAARMQKLIAGKPDAS